MTRTNYDNSVLYRRVDTDLISFSSEISSNQEILRNQQYNIEKPQIALYQ